MQPAGRRTVSPFAGGEHLEELTNMDARIARLLDEQDVRDACMAYWAG